MLNGEVARLVYRAAVKARPADLDLREKLLQVAAEVPLPAAAQLRQSILAGADCTCRLLLRCETNRAAHRQAAADLATDLSSSEDAWALRARAAEPAELASNAPSAVSGVQVCLHAFVHIKCAQRDQWQQEHAVLIQAAIQQRWLQMEMTCMASYGGQLIFNCTCLDAGGERT